LLAFAFPGSQYFCRCIIILTSTDYQTTHSTTTSQLQRHVPE
jgi:hypothetical protein